MINGKAKTVEDAASILSKSGYNTDNISALTSDYVIYWDKDENRMILYSKSEDNVIYPDEFIDKYKDVQGISMLWYPINTKETISEVTDKADLITKINASLSTSQSIIYKLTSDMVFDDANNSFVFSKTGVTNIDLNGKRLKLQTQNRSFNVSNNNHLNFENGTLIIERLDATEVSTSIVVSEGSSLTLNNVTYQTNGCAIYPEGASAEVNVIDSTIVTDGAYGISTNHQRRVISC